MKRTVGFTAVLLLGGVAFAQHGGPGGNVRSLNGGFGSVVFPGGGRVAPSRTANGFGNVVFPGLSRSPGSITDPTFASRLGRTVGGGTPNFNYGNGYGRGNHNRGQGYVYVPYAYPVYVGGYDASYYDQGVQQQSAPTIVYPPQAPPVTIINQLPPTSGSSQIVEVPQSGPSEDAGTPEPSASRSSAESGLGSYYLIAFKDHSIYSAVAYWIDGETLHYFTSGNVHNQASMSLVDRELTERLNKERDIDIRLPK